jgi:CHASE2 domain-containing sensor protein
MSNWLLKDIVGAILVITSIFDALKYSIQASKIRKTQSAKSQSRRFINWAIVNDIVKISYGFIILDWFIIISSALAILCMLDLWFTTYTFYPYRMRGCINFKKPPIFIYLINSIIPNRLRKRL